MGLGEGGVDRGAEVDEKGFVGFGGGVADHLHRQGLGQWPAHREGQAARGGSVVAAGGGGAVGGGPIHRYRGAGRR